MGFSRQDYWSGGWSWVHEYKNIVILWTPHGSPLPAGHRRRPSPQLLFWMPLPVSPYPPSCGQTKCCWPSPPRPQRVLSYTLSLGLQGNLSGTFLSRAPSYQSLWPDSPHLCRSAGWGGMGSHPFLLFVSVFLYISLALAPNVCLSVWSTGLRMHVKSH